MSVTKPDPDSSTNNLRHAYLGQRTVIKHTATAKKYSRSLVYAYYGARFNQIHQGSHEGYVGAREQFVNLGSPNDGFYVASNYSAWTLLLHLGTPDIQPSYSYSSEAVASLVLFGLICVAGGSGLAYFYRRRRLAQRRVHPIEAHFGDSVRERMDPVEPFQRRKLFHCFQNPQALGTSTEPLMPVDLPPSYDSVSHVDAL